jgi:glucose-1-phosphate adenylyltransferase
MHGVDIGRGAIVQNAILDKNVIVGAGVQLGVDPAADAARGLTVTDNGIVVIGKGERVLD